MDCQNLQSLLETWCRMYRPSFKDEWVGVRVWGALESPRAGRRDISLESPLKGLKGCWPGWQQSATTG